jgi:hypothetical protein
MKLVKMSLAAAMLVGASAYAEVKNVKFDGYAKVWYQTQDASNKSTDGLFEQTDARGDVSLNLGMSADVSEGMKFTARWQMLSTLGLESDVVSKRTHDTLTATEGLDDTSWASDLNIAYTAGKTTAVVGRQQLDTPLLFTEKWNSAYNTFDAVALVNKDVENLTLVGAYVGKHNGRETGAYGTVRNKFTTAGSQFGTGTHSAYGAGAVYGTDMIKAQGWYYDLNSLLTAYWVDAEVKMSGLFVGLQYGAFNPNNSVSGTYADSDVIGAKVGYTMDKKLNVYGAYSTTNDDANKATLGVQNIATGDKSKVYTQSVWTDGAVVGAEDTDSWKVGGSYKFEAVKVAASYAVADADKNGANKEYSEFDLIVSGKVGPLDMKVIYLNQDIQDKANSANDKDTDVVRIVATLPF